MSARRRAVVQIAARAALAPEVAAVDRGVARGDELSKNIAGNRHDGVARLRKFRDGRRLVAVDPQVVGERRAVFDVHLRAEEVHGVAERVFSDLRPGAPLSDPRRPSSRGRARGGIRVHSRETLRI